MDEKNSGKPSDGMDRKPERDLQHSVDQAVPDAEKLKKGFAENPISRQVASTIKRTEPEPGEDTVQGGKRVPS